MKIESHVTDLELSKRLEELGFNRITPYYWIVTEEVAFLSWNPPKSDVPNELDFITRTKETGRKNYYDLIYAYLATELLEMLPHEINRNDIVYYLSIFSIPDEYCSENYAYDLHYHSDVASGRKSFNNYSKYFRENMPNACAQLLIYLIENKVIEVPK